MPSTKANKTAKSRKSKRTKTQAKSRSTKSRSTKPRSTKSTKPRGTGSRSTRSKGAKRTRVAAQSVRTSKKTASASKAAGNGQARNAPVQRSTQGAAAKDQRQRVQERKILGSQSRWLQKALFALTKAADDQAKLAEVQGEAHEPMAVTVDGKTHELGEVTDSLRDAVMARLEALQVSFRNEHALMG